MTTTLIDAHEVARMTGFSAWTIRQMARQGRIPALKIGRSTRFDTTAVSAWMAQLPKASA